MNNIIILTTAISVSLDSFFCGLSMSLKTDRVLTFTLGIILSVFALCLLGSFLGVSLGNALLSISQLVSGCILLIIAFSNFFKINDNKKMLSNNESNLATFKESVFIGFAVGLDGAVGSFSLSLIYDKGLIIPLLITALHVLLIDFSILITNNRLIKKLTRYEFIPTLILLLLGVYKILEFFL